MNQHHITNHPFFPVSSVFTTEKRIDQQFKTKTNVNFSKIKTMNSLTNALATNDQIFTPNYSYNSFTEAAPPNLMLGLTKLPLSFNTVPGAFSENLDHVR